MFTKKTQLATAMALLCAGVAQAGDVNFSGFLTAAGGKLDDEKSGAYAGYASEDLVFDADTLVGIQVSGVISEKVTATAQLVARGIEDYEVSAEWAYISYQVNDNFQWRMGRLRMPLYTYSDYLDVGYAYHWIRAPREVYYLPFNNIQGLDFLWNYSVGSWDGSVQMYTGAFTDSFFNSDTQSIIDTQSRNHMGVAFTIGNDWLTFRLARHQAELSLSGYGTTKVIECVFTPQLCADAGATGNLEIRHIDAYLRSVGAVAAADDLQTTSDDDGSFTQIGVTVDTGRFVAAAESVEFEIEGSPFSIDKRWYVMLGMRFGDVLVHVTKAEAKDEAADLTANLPNALSGLTPLLEGIAEGLVDEHDTLTLGVRWDFTSSTALKFQYDSMTDYETDEVTGEDLDQKLISFAIQTVF